MAFDVKDIDESQAPLMDHLIELRTRLIRSILALLLAFGVCLYFASDILGFLIRQRQFEAAQPSRRDLHL